jgi:hypothetical protein
MKMADPEGFDPGPEIKNYIPTLFKICGGVLIGMTIEKFYGEVSITYLDYIFIISAIILILLGVRFEK